MPRCRSATDMRVSASLNGEPRPLQPAGEPVHASYFPISLFIFECPRRTQLMRSKRTEGAFASEGDVHHQARLSLPPDPWGASAVSCCSCLMRLTNCPHPAASCAAPIKQTWPLAGETYNAVGAVGGSWQHGCWEGASWPPAWAQQGAHSTLAGLGRGPSWHPVQCEPFRRKG